MNDDLWLAAPCAAVKLWMAGEAVPRWQTNAAAREWARAAGIDEAGWSALAARLWREAGTAGSGHLDAPALHWTAVPMDGARRFFWLCGGTCMQQAAALAVEQARRQREAAERESRAKSEFLARISHELRTPLNAVLGFAQLMERDDAHPLAPAQRERVARIRSAGRHLLALIGDVLDLSAIEAGQLVLANEPVSLDAVLADVASWLAPVAETARIALHVQRCDGWVAADAQRLRQIVAHLAGDALGYGAPGGSVWLGARRDDVSDPAAPGWFVHVRDDGRGLTAAEREHLADSAARIGERLGLDDAGSGTAGLALTIARRLAEFMGGRIDVVPHDGEGSEFRVRLKAAEPPKQAASATDAGTRLAVLYIEDNPVNAVLVKELVAMRPDITLADAPDGVSGVARAVAERPDVVLIDMQLPDIDGYEVLRRLRAQPALARSAMIALSANGMSEDIARARAAGFDDYWTKPIDFRRFLAGLDALAAARRGQCAGGAAACVQDAAGEARGAAPA